jgi:glycosyltransferase involved in cell wall biosynthesis
LVREAARVIIAYLVSKYPAPSHTFIRREISALRKLGLDIDTYSIRPGESLTPEDRAEEERTFRVLPVGWPSLLLSQLMAMARRPRRWLGALGIAVRHADSRVTQLPKTLAYFAEAMRLAAALERRGATHLHNHFANPAAHVGLIAAHYLGIPWSLSLHGASDFSGPTSHLLGRKVTAARFVATATQYGRAQAMRATDPSEWNKICLVRCGVEVARLPPRPRRRQLSGTPIEILSVGRLSQEKGHVGLIEAFAKLVGRGVDARLVLIGGGPEEPRIRRAVEALGLEGQVALRGAQPESEVLEAMTRTHVFALSSLMEGLPVVLMEALALGLPVIAPQVAGIPELVAHERTGLLFPAGDWDALCDRMTTLAGDSELRSRLGAAGRARVLEEFEITRAVQPLASLFRAASGGSTVRSRRDERGLDAPRRSGEGLA